MTGHLYSPGCLEGGFPEAPGSKVHADHADEITLAVYTAHIQPYCGVYDTGITWIRSKLLRLAIGPVPLGTTLQVLVAGCSEVGPVHYGR
jgi:hypothetical protein